MDILEEDDWEVEDGWSFNPFDSQVHLSLVFLKVSL